MMRIMYWVLWYDIFCHITHPSQWGMISQSSSGKCLGGCEEVDLTCWRWDSDDDMFVYVGVSGMVQRQRSSIRSESWQSQASAWLCWWWASCAWWPTAKPSKYTAEHFLHDYSALSLIGFSALHSVAALSTLECVMWWMWLWVSVRKSDAASL